MKRGLAIALTYIGLLLVPIMLIALIVPPLITEANNFAENVPQYADDLTEFVQENERLRELNEDYDVTGKLEEEAGKLPERLGGAAGTLRDIGFGIVNSLFALLTILVMTAFLLGSGPVWRDQILASRPPEQRQRLRRSLEHMASAVSGYVAGALTIAMIAGIQTFIVLSILGVPFSGPLAVIAGLMSLIPMVGATIAAVLIGVVTLFENFPTATIIWAIWAIVYQQLENNLIQPQIQKRTVKVHPFITIVAVLFGGTLLGVLGAIVAIPVAASIQILIREYVDLRTLSLRDTAPAPRSLQPMSPGALTRRGLLLLVTAVSLYLLAPALLEVFGAFDELDEISPLWFPAMVALQVGSYACIWGVQRLVGARRALGPGRDLAARRELVRARGARRRGRRGRDAVRDARARRRAGRRSGVGDDRLVPARLRHAARAAPARTPRDRRRRDRGPAPHPCRGRRRRAVRADGGRGRGLRRLGPPARARGPGRAGRDQPLPRAQGARRGPARAAAARARHRDPRARRASGGRRSCSPQAAGCSTT